MSRTARALAPLAAALALLAAGCGGGEPASEGASFAPAGAELFLSVDTDLDSERWERAGALLDRFPDGDRLVRSLLGELADEGIDFDEDVRPALGPEVGIVALDLAGETFVGFTKPPDRRALEDLVRDRLVTRDVGEWTVVAEDEAALDAFAEARGRGSLADDEPFAAVMEGVSSDALAHIYLSPDGLAGALEAPPAVLEGIFGEGGTALAAALVPEEDGARLEAALRLDEESPFVGDPYRAELPDAVPADVLAYISFRDLERPLSAWRDTFAEVEPELERDVARLEAAVGVSLEEDVFPLLAGEGALYVRAGGFLPDVTLLLEVEDEEAARATLARLVEAIPDDLPVGPARDVEIAGVDAVEVPILGAPIALYYATFDGRLAVTTSREGIAVLREEGERLGDDEDFREALEQAGVPDESLGFAYVDVGSLASLVFAFAGLGAPPGDLDVVRRNLEPLRHAVVHGERDGDLVTVEAFVAIE